jgi:hypothetical protein
MSVDRRGFLQGCTGVGLLATSAALGAHPLATLAAPLPPDARANVPARRVVLLRAAGDEPFADEPFAQAVLDATSAGLPVRIESLPLDPALARTPGALRAALDAHRGATLLGLLDDCTHTLLEETLRDLGAALLCRGQHYGSTIGPADSRHLFTTTARARGIGTALAGALAADPYAYLVREQSLAANQVPGTGTAAAAAAAEASRRLAAHWPAALGTAYARIAAGRWDASAVTPLAQRGTVVAAHDARPFVSLIASLP